MHILYKRHRYPALFATFLLAGLSVWVSIGQRSVLGLLCAIFVFCVGFMLTTSAANIFLLLGSIAFTLALSELSLKLSFHQDPLTSSPDSAYVKPIYWSKSDLGFQPPPGRHTSKKLTSAGEVVYDAVYSIGEDGFRITPVIHTGSIHINFFGCSLMFGEGLNDDETLPYFLHELDLRISVKNFAWHGYGVHQALRILESIRDTKGNINFLLTSP